MINYFSKPLLSITDIHNGPDWCGRTSVYQKHLNSMIWMRSTDLWPLSRCDGQVAKKPWSYSVYIFFLSSESMQFCLAVEPVFFFLYISSQLCAQLSYNSSSSSCPMCGVCNKTKRGYGCKVQRSTGNTAQCFMAQW